MHSDDIEKPAGEKPWLTVSDWICFLTHEANKERGFQFAFFAAFISIVAICMSVLNIFDTDNHWLKIEYQIGMLLFIIVLYLRVNKELELFNKHAKAAEEVLNDIFDGKLKTEEAIHKKWKIITEKKAKSHQM
ncbi:MAG: hypothetical protein WC749_05930 [Dehalococcoidia bacterium]